MKTRSLLAGLLAWAPLVAAAPETGAKVPDFEFTGEGGILHRRSEAEAEGAQQLQEFDVDVFYVSLDTPEKNAAFAASMGADMVRMLGDVGFPKRETTAKRES